MVKSTSTSLFLGSFYDLFKGVFLERGPEGVKVGFGATLAIGLNNPCPSKNSNVDLTTLLD